MCVEKLVTEAAASFVQGGPALGTRGVTEGWRWLCPSFIAGAVLCGVEGI